jgi:uncharacterized membrane protein YdbT with pleckstrin-like domain
MSGQWLPEPGVQALERYVVPNEEKLVFVMRKHPVMLAEPVASAVLWGFLMIALVARFAQTFPAGVTVTVLLWLAVAGRAVYYVLEWRASWFGSTQRRLMLTYGLFTRKVAMMPLEKVTDMSYNRSPAGQVFGYGEFVLESAGQEQALRSVTFVPNPDQVYRRLVATMFGPKKLPPEAGIPQTVSTQRPRSTGAGWRPEVDTFPSDNQPTTPLQRKDL